MKLIVGLGNPGFRYRNTRHNIGFLIIDNFKKTDRSASGRNVVLLKPQLFMNNSGIAVKKAVGKFNVPPEDVLVVCDDINLALGIIRLRPRGSAGGHGGLKSIIKEMATEGFNRLRVGIGSGREGTLKDYVLSKFEPDEKKDLKEAVGRAAEAVHVWVEEGIEAAMNKFNVKNKER